MKSVRRCTRAAVDVILLRRPRLALVAAASAAHTTTPAAPALSRRAGRAPRRPGPAPRRPGPAPHHPGPTPHHPGPTPRFPAVTAPMQPAHFLDALPKLGNVRVQLLRFLHIAGVLVVRLLELGLLPRVRTLQFGVLLPQLA